MPDLIVMDIQLPHVSGLELIAELKADSALAAIPMLAVTAYRLTCGRGEGARGGGGGLCLQADLADALHRSGRGAAHAED